MNTGRLWAALAITAALAGCATDDDSRVLVTQAPGAVVVRNNAGPALSPFVFNAGPAAVVATQAPHRLALEDDRPPGHCSLRDRFDRKEVIAYNFSDGQSRLGLKLGVDGFSLSDPGFKFEEIKVNFRYRLQPVKNKREKCLYASPWQGLVGSGYNELVLREEHTVYEALDDEIDDAYDRLDKLFGE